MSKKRSIGIMQGRLTPSKGRGIQFFPFDNWEQEFFDCREMCLDEIEWIFDYDGFENNPLWSYEGTKYLSSVINSSGIRVNSICLDYFMRRPFFKVDNFSDRESIKNENTQVISRIFENMSIIGANLIEIPLVDFSSIKTHDEEKMMVDFLRTICNKAMEYRILVGIESDYPPDVFFRFIDSLECQNARANYDSGNSSGLGYDHVLEINNLGNRLQNLHIKDRLFGNGTVPLGTGSADFDKVFSSLKKIGYDGSIILQAARSVDGKEKENIDMQVGFIKDYLTKYDLFYV